MCNMSKDEIKPMNNDNKNDVNSKYLGGKFARYIFEIIGSFIVILFAYGIKTCNECQESSGDSEITNIENGCSTSIGSQIESEIMFLQSQMPIKVDDITSIVDVKFTDSAVVYVYDIDDYDVALCDYDQDGIKADILAEWGSRDKRQKLMAQFCVETNRSVIFQYHSTNTDDSFTITFTPSNLKSKM